MRSIKSLIFMSTLMFCSGSTALELQDYERIRGNEMIDLYIGGVATGIFWSSLQIKSQGNAPLYCPPEKLAFTTGQYVSILDRYIAGQSLVPDYPVELAMLLALRDAFPCDG